MSLTLMEACETREEAESKVHIYAETIRNMGMSAEFGAAALCRGGTWGVWVRDRREGGD